MITYWNLMCRSANAFTIKHSHMEWKRDSLGVFFAQMKNDQGGERPKDARHVYPNPLMPEICPLLSLGIYWLTRIKIIKVFTREIISTIDFARY